MAGLNRRFTLALFALPFLFVVMSGLARANDIVVNTTSGESELAPLCSLPDAITAHNIQGTVVGSGCGPGSADDAISFAVTGIISIDESLEITSGHLSITGPTLGCSGPGPCGITIDGEGIVQIVKTDPGTTVTLKNLTLNHGFAASGIATGGAIFANGTDLEILESLIENSQASSNPGLTRALGGGIYVLAGTVEITNSTLANNTAIENPTLGSIGGAIYSASPSLIKISNSTIVGNAADFGGALGPGIYDAKGTIFAKNTAGVAAPNCFGLPTDVNYNIADDGSCFFSQPQSVNNATAMQLALDPLGLQNNGGPTETIALEAGSIAIDRIPVANCTDQQTIPQPLGTDQRLFGRPDPANLNTCDSGAYEAGAVAPIVLAKGTERVQIARNPGTPNADKVNIGLTFIYNGDPDCDLGPMGDEDALNFGFGIALIEGTCASLPNSGMFLLLDPFVVHTVNHQSYGTLSAAVGSATVSARLVALPTPVNACGAWTLNLEVAGLNTPALGLGGGNPFAILISDLEDVTQCFDVTNAIVGTQIPTPAHSVRRGVRRQNRR